MIKNNTSSNVKLISWIWLLLCLIIYCINCFSISSGNTDSDISSELILAKDLADRNQFVFSDNWFYSTEIRVISLNLLYSPLFQIIDDWFLVKRIGSTIAVLLMIAALFFLCRQLKIKNLFPFAAGALLLPLSKQYFLMVLYEAYYAIYIALAFLGIGLAFYFATKKHTLLKKCLVLGALGFIAFAFGLTSMRMLLTLSIPLFLAILLAFPAVNISTEMKAGNRKRISMGRIAKRLSIAVIVFLICSLIGYLIHSVVLVKIYPVKTFEALKWTSFNLEGAAQLITGVLRSFGFQEGYNVIGRQGIANGLALILTVLLVIVVSQQSRIRALRLNPKLFFLCYYLISSFTILLIIFSFSDMYFRERFLIPCINFSLLILFGWLLSMWYRHNKEAPRKSLLMIISMTCICCLSIAASFSFSNLKAASGQASEANEIVGYLQQNEYSDGFSTYWNGNALTELSNGNLELWTLDNNAQEVSDLKGELQLKSHFSNYPSGKIFVLVQNGAGITMDANGFSPLVSYEVSQVPLFKKLNEDNIVYRTDNYLIYSYDNMTDLNADINGYDN